MRRVLSEIFPKASFKESINPDEAAVHGAAVLAHYFQKEETILMTSLSQLAPRIKLCVQFLQPLTLIRNLRIMK